MVCSPPLWALDRFAVVRAVLERAYAVVCAGAAVRSLLDLPESTPGMGGRTDAARGAVVRHLSDSPAAAGHLPEIPVQHPC
ncbi:hypothetical protein D3C73_1242490 [compost metagenome]